MKIQVLGSGCPNCESLFQLTKKAVKELKLKEEVEYLAGPEGVMKIIAMGVVSSPVLVIDDQPVLVGFTDNLEEIKKVIQEHKKNKK